MALSFSMAPVFIKSDSLLGAVLMNENGLPRLTQQESSTIYDRVMSRIQNMSMEDTLLGVEFWESLKNGTLKWTTVRGGFLVYDYGQGLDFGSSAEHNDLVLCNEQYMQSVVECYSLVTTVEVSDPAQDWIGQEMIKPHVRMIKDMLKFTDDQIRNGLQMLHDRDEPIIFGSLMQILRMREDAVNNIYVGTMKYAFSADVQRVLHECYDVYGREPTPAEFDYQYNRIKEHLINQLAVKDEEVTNINRDKERLQERARLLDNQVAMEQARAVQERNRADLRHREKLDALKEANIAMEARNEAQELANEAIDGIIQEQNKAKAIEERMRLKAVKLKKEKEEERAKAEEERAKAEEERAKAEEERAKAAKLEQEKEEERAKAEEERAKAAKLEQEKEEARVKAEAEREQLMKFFEEEKRKMMAQFEAEKRQLLLQMQQQQPVYAS